MVLLAPPRLKGVDFEALEVVEAEESLEQKFWQSSSRGSQVWF